MTTYNPVYPVVVTAENIEDVRACIAVVDQRDALEVGCETWSITYSGGQSGQMTVWPKDGRGAVCYGGDSDWGDWNSVDRTLTLEDGRVIDEFGEAVADDEETA